MRTKISMRHLAWGVLGLVSQQAFSQATQADNIGGFGSFLGWNAGANQILEVKNEANEPIDMFTNDIHRFRLLPDATYVVNPGLPAKTADGWALLCPDVAGFYSNGAPGPFSLLHLSDGLTNVMTSDRAWMNIGITFTGAIRPRPNAPC